MAHQVNEEHFLGGIGVTKMDFVAEENCASMKVAKVTFCFIMTVHNPKQIMADFFFLEKTNETLQENTGAWCCYRQQMYSVREYFLILSIFEYLY